MSTFTKAQVALNARAAKSVKARGIRAEQAPRRAGKQVARAAKGARR